MSDDKSNYGIDYIKPEFLKPQELIKLELEWEEVYDRIERYCKYKWITEYDIENYYKPQIKKNDEKINNFKVLIVIEIIKYIYLKINSNIILYEHNIYIFE